MIKHIDDLSWGTYKEYEGPYYLGSAKYVLPANPTVQEEILSVVTATEGGAYDAFNGYDRCIVTAGVIQMCEAGMFGVSDLLGYLASTNRNWIGPLEARCTGLAIDFKPNAKGRWRFHFRDARSEVDTLEEQQQLFLLRANGKKGYWDDASKEYARRWAAAIINTLVDKRTHRAQAAWCAKKLEKFCTVPAQNILKSAESSPYPRAHFQVLKAAFISFAANNPLRAETDLKLALRHLGGNPFDLCSAEGLREALWCLTFNSNVAIYPGRYNKIRPVLERLYAVDLPDFAGELRGIPVWDTVEVQLALLRLGYSLGPRGADGAWGAKSKAALQAFEQAAGLVVTDGSLLPSPTAYALARALEVRGIKRSDLTA
jgi:hypothetical protein